MDSIFFSQAAEVAHWAIIIILIAGIIGVVFVVLRESGITIPGFIITILWIVLACVLGVIAIKFLINYI